MAQKVSLINMKGGVGKSTLSVNIAWEMATAPWNKRVLVVDLDPQFNCSQYLVGASTMEEIILEAIPTVWHIMEQYTRVPGGESTPLAPEEAITTVKSSSRNSPGLIDLIPSQLELSYSLRNPAGKEDLLRQTIEQLEDEYDLVVIDCAPTDSFLTTAAYRASDYILIPVRPTYLSTIGLPLLEQSLNDFVAQYPGEEPEVLGIVFNAIAGYSPEEDLSKNSIQRIARTSGWPVFDAEVRHSQSFPTSARNGTPIFSTRYAHTTTKRNFHQFAQEFAQRIGL